MPPGRVIEMEQIQHSVVDVATTSTLVADSSPRAYLLITNDSDAVIYLCLGYTATLNHGIRLNANGGTFEMGLRFGNVFMGPIYAIHGDAGTKKLLLTGDA